MTLLITSLPLAPFFLMFVYIRTLFRFVLIGGNLTAQFTGSHRGIHSRIKIPSPSSSSPATRASWWAWLQASHEFFDLQKHFKLSQIPLLLSKQQCPVIWKPVHNLNCGLANSILQLIRPGTFPSTTFDILQFSLLHLYFMFMYLC